MTLSSRQSGDTVFTATKSPNPLSPAADPTLEPGCPADVTWKGWKIMQIGPLCERQQPPSAAGKARPALCIVQSPQNSGHWQATNETAR
ncbi:hypothetical protein VTI28DRAFT_9376 [Corynascus sepedonium]